MVEIADIKDRDSLRAWLKDQPQQVSVWIVHRSAMRLLPQWWAYKLKPAATSPFDMTALPILQLNLLSGVTQKNPTPESKNATRTADAAAAAAAHVSVYEAAYAVARAAAAAAYAVDRDASAASATRTDPYYGLHNTTADAWLLIRADCTAISSGDDLDGLALWGEEVNPLADVWHDVKQKLSVSSPARSDEPARGAVAVDWSFWVRWYDDALAGNPPNWDMLERIALIDPEEWDKGAEVVNPLIAEIVAQFEGNATAQNEFIPSPVSPVARTAIVERVQQNREVLAFSIAGVLEQISEFRERIRGINDLDQAHRENVFEYLDGLSAQLADLLAQLPEANQVVEEAQADKLVTWGQQFRHSFVGKAKEYAAAENVAGAAVPTGIILGCTAIGTVFGPAGALAGGVVGRLITGELKPSKAADALIEDHEPPKEE